MKRSRIAALALLLACTTTAALAADRFPRTYFDIECSPGARASQPAEDGCSEPFDALAREFPETNGATQRICATGRYELSTPTVRFEEMMLDQVLALCDMWGGMPRTSEMWDRDAHLLADTASIRKALTDVEVLIENTLNASFGAIDSLFNQADNAVQDAVNPMFNLIDGEICPGDCWPTNPVNVPNLNLPNSLSNIDFDPFENVVDLAEIVIENPDAISLMCLSPTLREVYRDHLVDTLPPTLAGLNDTFDYTDAESTCAANGGHVCSAPELLQLARGTTPGALGVQQGDWVQGGDVVAAPNSFTRDLFETPWPPVEIDLSPLLSVPPGIPFAISWPVLPTGGYRCCQSTVDF